MSQDTGSYRKASKIRSENIPPSPSKQIKPERNLLAAILARAILDLYGDSCIDRIQVASARGWLHEKPIQKEKAFSFGWVAQHLDLDPEILQTHLRTFPLDLEKKLKALNFLR